MGFSVDFQTDHFNVAVTDSETPATFRAFDLAQEVDIFYRNVWGGSYQLRDQQMSPADDGELSLEISVIGSSDAFDLELHGYDADGNSIQDTVPVAAGTNDYTSNLTFASLHHVISGDTFSCEIRIYQTRLGAIGLDGTGYKLWGMTDYPCEISGLAYLQIGTDSIGYDYFVLSNVNFDALNYQGDLTGGSITDFDNYRGCVVVIKKTGIFILGNKVYIPYPENDPIGWTGYGGGIYKSLWTYCDEGVGGIYGSMYLYGADIYGPVKILRGEIYTCRFHGQEMPAPYQPPYPTIPVPETPMLYVGDVALDGTNQVIHVNDTTFQDIPNTNTWPQYALQLWPHPDSDFTIENVYFKNVFRAILGNDTEVNKSIRNADFSFLGTGNYEISYGVGRAYFTFRNPSGLLGRFFGGSGLYKENHGIVAATGMLKIYAKTCRPDVSTWKTCGQQKELTEINLTGATIYLYDNNGNCAWKQNSGRYWEQPSDPTWPYLTDGATMINVNGGGAVPEFSAGQYIWIGQEMMKISDTWLGDSPIEVSRGECATSAQYHATHPDNTVNRAIRTCETSKSMPTPQPLEIEVLYAYFNKGHNGAGTISDALNPFTLVVLISGFYPHYQYVNILGDTIVEIVLAPYGTLFDHLDG